MGGRGASSGLSDKGKRYGTEYKTLAQFGNVKVVRANDGGAKSPMETMTPGRIYATVDKFNDIKYITFHDADGERVKQIDVKGKKHNGALPHTHNGYFNTVLIFSKEPDISLPRPEVRLLSKCLL